MRIFLPLLLFLSIYSFSQGRIDTLTNSSIIQLKNAGIGNELIKLKIQESANKFDVSTNGLIQLKKAGISDDIIQSMMTRGNSRTEQATVGNNNSKGSFENVDYSYNNELNTKNIYSEPKRDAAPGLYYCKGKPCQLIELDPSIYSSGKVGSGLGTALTYGISKTKSRSIISGSNANLQLSEKQPEFFFYFFNPESNQNVRPGMNDLFSNASSPNEFFLVKLEQGKNSREVVTGSAGIGGSSVGVDEKFRVPFRYEKLGQGVYRVYFEKPLIKGEYAFMYAGAISANGTSALQKAYDFGVF